MDLGKNPICIMPYYKEICIQTVPNLSVFDTKDISVEERVMITATANTSLCLASRKNRMLLLFLEKLNRPNIGDFIVPHDQPPQKMIILVGPPASRRKIIANEFVKRHKR